MVIRWLLGLPHEDEGELDEDWEEVGRLEQQALMNQDEELYKDFRSKESQANSKQRESDRKQVTKPPGRD